MIKAVLFDYGGVLSPGGKTISGVYSKLLGIPEDQVDLKGLHSEFRRGDISAEDFFIELSRLYGKPVTAEKFVEYSDIFVKNQKVYILADSLRLHGIKTGILSNVYQLSADILSKDGYYTNFDPILLSSETGLAKPDPEFYKLAIKRLGVKAEEILFIDDQEKCLPPARSLGMHIIRADSEDQIVADTKTLIQKENGLDL
ncbi:MAG: HAD family phosphatase [Candidatus Saccharibacteria bacterium]